MDRFNNPVQPDNTDAIFVKDLGLFILQASHPVSLEPTELGGRHHVISFYDAYDEEKLQSRSAEMAAITTESNRVLTKLMESMSEAIRIHDEWEQVNIARMMWNEHEQLIESLKNELFGTMKLHKKSTVSHRIAGSLAPGWIPRLLSFHYELDEKKDSHERIVRNREIDDVENTRQRGGTSGD